MNYVLTVRSADGRDDEVLRQVANLRGLLTDKDLHVVGRPAATADGPGVESKADPVTLGAVVLAFLSGGAVASVQAIREVVAKLIDAVSASHPASKTAAVEYELAVSAGGETRSVKFKGQQLNAGQVDATQATLERFVNETQAAAPAVGPDAAEPGRGE
ncbi:MAG TPA: hypothetical protein VD866_10120 [Urbifossiella sp.]|nr:hypothetical protein [Urbifossiella sp.]